jgi:hypothetical protein
MISFRFHEDVDEIDFGMYPLPVNHLGNCGIVPPLKL